MAFNENNTNTQEDIPTVDAEIVEISEDGTYHSGPSKNTSPKKPKKPHKKGSVGRKIFFGLLIVILLIAILGSAVAITEGKGKKNGGSQNGKIDSSANIKVSDSKEYKSESADGTLTSVQIAEKVKPSVIAVITYKGNTVAGEGSGVVMSEDDQGNTYILTCAHIVSSGGITVKVELQDETQYDAQVVGYDTRTDIAVLRVASKGFTVAEFGDSSVLKVGEPVYAIGNPGGTAFYGSFTGGYVSAIDRPTSTSSSGYTMECIQHDAAINPGNSGGALVNSFGQVIGINSSKIADEDYEGMGFAIPINVAKDVVADILENGYVANRAKLGITYLPVGQNRTYSTIAEKNHLPSGAIIVATIDDNSAFTGTDVKSGDVIIAANGKKLTKSDVLLNIIEKSSPGDKISLTMVRIKDDYSVEKYEVEVSLIEDKGSAESTTGTLENGEGFTNPFAQ